jgi:cytochrome c-type biogenesis protein CcmH
MADSGMADSGMADQGTASRPARTWARRPAVAFAALLLVTLGALAAVAVGATGGRGPAATPADQVHAIAAGLRCPVCRDLSVADSPAPLAQQMRTQIAERLAAGKGPDAIREEFVAAYGESVLLVPPRRGVGLVAWLAPAVLLAAGLLVAVLALCRWRAGGAAPPAPSAPPSDADRALLQRALARFEEEAQ